MYDAPDMIAVIEPIAKKAHTCYECRREIAPGEQYQRVRGLWVGEWAGFKSCLPCARLRERLDKFTCDPIVFGELEDAAICFNVPFPPQR